jgi:hypothetical protein
LPGEFIEVVQQAGNYQNPWCSYPGPIWYSPALLKWLSLAADWRVDSWLLQGYKQLVEAPGGISEEDEHRLKWEKTSKRFWIRDEYLQTLHKYSYRHSAFLQSSLANNIVLSKIKTMFEKELEDAVLLESFTAQTLHQIYCWL